MTDKITVRRDLQRAGASLTGLGINPDSEHLDLDAHVDLTAGNRSVAIVLSGHWEENQSQVASVTEPTHMYEKLRLLQSYVSSRITYVEE